MKGLGVGGLVLGLSMVLAAPVQAQRATLAPTRRATQSPIQASTLPATQRATHAQPTSDRILRRAQPRSTPPVVTSPSASLPRTHGLGVLPRTAYGLGVQGISPSKPPLPARPTPPDVLLEKRPAPPQ